MAVICPGFMGLASLGIGVNSIRVRCTDFSINPKQDTLFYDHVIGLNDTVPADSTTKGEAVGTIQTQKRIWRPSTILVQGGISFPATEESLDFLFSHVKYGTYFDMSFKYYRDPSHGRRFRNCRINSFSFTATAGDIVTISADIIAMEMDDSGGPAIYLDPQKLITWDKVVITSPDIPTSFAFEALDFTVNNNAKPIYTVKGTEGTVNNLSPFDLRLGMQEVTGTLTLYNKGGQDFLINSTGSTDLRLVCPGLNTHIFVIFKPREINGAIGPVITTLPFIGIDKAFGA